jgi:hypothetical protein
MLSGTRSVAGALLLLALGGCGEGGLAGGLRSVGVAGTPDEFMVLPTRPLEMPENLASLPPPVPGAANRVDARPQSEAVTGLTGRPGPAGTASAGALVARAGPVDPNIRATLRAEDAAIRQLNPGKVLERLLSREPDTLAYRTMTLNAAAEYERLRARGLRVPAAPPGVLVP